MAYCRQGEYSGLFGSGRRGCTTAIVYMVFENLALPERENAASMVFGALHSIDIRAGIFLACTFSWIMYIFYRHKLKKTFRGLVTLWRKGF